MDESDDFRTPPTSVLSSPALSRRQSDADEDDDDTRTPEELSLATRPLPSTDYDEDLAVSAQALRLATSHRSNGSPQLASPTANGYVETRQRRPSLISSSSEPHTPNRSRRSSSRSSLANGGTPSRPGLAIRQRHDSALSDRPGSAGALGRLGMHDQTWQSAQSTRQPSSSPSSSFSHAETPYVFAEDEGYNAYASVSQPTTTDSPTHERSAPLDGAFTSVRLSPDTQKAFQLSAAGTNGRYVSEKTVQDKAAIEHKAEEPNVSPKATHKKRMSGNGILPIKIDGSPTRPRHTRSPSLQRSPKQERASVQTSQAFTDTFKKTKSTKPATKATVLQQVVSSTRPHHLPPKSKLEEQKHLQQLDHMRIAAKETEKKKRAAAAIRKQARDRAAAEAFSTWEKEILPNWHAVGSSAKLRDVWWSGTMPVRYRANLWSLCIGNGLAISKGSYAKAHQLVSRLLTSSTYPEEILIMIDHDISRTMPNIKLFDKENGPMWSDLRNLLLAHSVFWRDRPSYAPGICFPAAMLLISMPPPEAFVALVNLVNKSCLKSFYAGVSDEIEAYYRIFGTLLADTMPKVYRNFVAHDVRPNYYLGPWLTTLYTPFLPLDFCTRIFDVFVLEGDSFLFRFALALLQAMEPRLFDPESDALERIFAGTDAGGRAIASRTKGVPESQITPQDVYEAYGLEEDEVFAIVKSTEWKDSTWSRLVERELPD
ncbi:uncharacterized protein L969DRAFT_63337 [Mixia osmundae IAM 14324]|uniref:Rab-GAP TBC domain-containing protein n=1 Tax=Mixia osmundae (strain CBS 9802 / IAM 14324 / JCM 22182 / KY 12970) TaxID=764103 RepID=G7E730_MIXOS|nr:uncharacterized protein L969DRAFT_63337 [Mixia osmundae IAM 14324]KEI38977.1 hypothetical protein L969DRAFT_63337 [Mixia osmundae IAM 14324]GAA98640.1 hypothetical protein E5Q_05327 [Mixia osmundae IAM 14324]